MPDQFAVYPAVLVERLAAHVFDTEELGFAFCMRPVLTPHDLEAGSSFSVDEIATQGLYDEPGPDAAFVRSCGIL